MKQPIARLSTTAAAVLSAIASLNLHAAPGLAPWLTQMGETTTILSAANWGKGQVLGVVDTGIVASNPVFAAGQVSNVLSSCAATSFKCSNGAMDDNGHGTAVASIAAANKPTAYTYLYSGYTVAANSFIGVAPNANIVAEKVLNASGSGYNTDVSNGINKAVAAGVSVINLSLTYMATPDIIAAVNNAAAKGVFIVWAGGNDGKALLANANTSGLTKNAVNHLVFAGALDTTAAKAASFSSSPGAGSLVDTGGGKTSYASRWISAPGVNIMAPGIQYGPGAMALWSGTSMAAPLISGSLLLLESAWPILKTNGTAANLLLGTANDLGTKGVDSVYGTGLVNLTTAFQPVGGLSVTQANGKAVPVTSLTGSMLTGGALGNLSTVRSKLASYTALDTYARNFTVDLSGLIQTKPTAAKQNPLPSNLNSGVAVMKLSNGGELSRWQTTATTLVDRMGVFWNGDFPEAPEAGYMTYTNGAGSTLSMGYGIPSQLSFAKALYGDSDLSLMAGDLSMSNLSDLSQGGYHLAYGTKVDKETRVAVAFSQTPTTFYAGNPTLVQTGGAPNASNVLLGITHRLNERWTGGVSLGQLNEKSGLLGANYASGSAISLGSNRTNSVGFSLGYAIDANNSLLAEVGFGFTQGSNSGGLLAGTSDIQSRSYGMTYLSKQLLNQNDKLTVSVKQPLRIVAGTVGVTMPSIDSLGVAHYAAEKVSLVPNGRELDFAMAYDTPIGKTQSLSLQFSARQDVMNVAGSRDASIGAIWSAKF
ncbi:MAG TPA: S8 family serine peptidase [Accumulibacter sp.]|jgi:hypothetical protein|nr:S8 family serine peptidase [Accumulibacter sp.]HQC79871.1 S8 family serine peptidase [Accumulibacter sp.]